MDSSRSARERPLQKTPGGPQARQQPGAAAPPGGCFPTYQPLREYLRPARGVRRAWWVLLLMYIAITGLMVAVERQAVDSLAARQLKPGEKGTKSTSREALRQFGLVPA